jgi:glycosyltransferase involved in cell wall biosynthesis
MKILFILHYPPPVHGSSVVGQSIKNSNLINESFRCRHINLLVSREMNETGKPSSKKIFRFIGIWFKFLYEILFRRPDLCYLALTVSGSAFFKDVLLVAILRVLRIQHVFHLHNKGVSFNRNKIIRLIYRFVFKKADVILLSSLLYPDIEDFVSLSRIHICPNGIDEIYTDHIPRIVYENKKTNILFLSNLSKSKGVFVLLDACTILQEKGIDFECNFVGAEGDICESEFNIKVIQKHLSAKVHYLGKKFYRDKHQMFEEADIFAFPTFFECFGLVNLEAMQSYLPIVSTLEGGIPDIIDDGITGFLVPPKNAQAFAEKLEVLIKNPELRVKMGKAGRLKYVNEFKLSIFEQNLKNIFLQISQKRIKVTNPLAKVLFFLHLPPPVHGSSIVGNLIYNSRLINDSFECNYINLLVSRTLNETGKSSPLKISRFIVIWVKFLYKIVIKRPRLTYLALTVSGSAFYKDVILVAVLRLFRIKRIYHLHNKGVSYFRSKKIYNFFYPFVFKDADIILLSNYLYKDIEAYVPLSRVHICPNGIKDEVSSSESKLLNNGKRVNILFLSNLIDSKGVTILLEACSILHQKGIDFECDFIGAEGDVNSSVFNKKVRLFGIEKKVNYLGHKYGLDKKEYFANADIFSFPTFYPNECFPLVLIEAMSFSLPVVSTFEGGIPDIVDDGITGFLVPQKNAQALAEKLKVLIENSELRQQMGNNGRKKYENELTLELFENRLKEILQEVIEKH